MRKIKYTFALLAILSITACSTNNPMPPDIDKNSPWVPISPNYKTN